MMLVERKLDRRKTIHFIKCLENENTRFLVSMINDGIHHTSSVQKSQYFKGTNS